MDSRSYLKRYGWEEGEALKKGGIKRPILVKHKKDKKGIGHVVSGSADAWWERLFDGQLKSLDVNNDKKDGISFKQDKIIASSISREDSPLYRMFVRGEILQGTTGKVNFSNSNPAVDSDQVNKEVANIDIDKFKVSLNNSKPSDNLTDTIPRDKKPVDRERETKSSDKRAKREKKKKKKHDKESKSSKKQEESLASKQSSVKAKNEETADDKSHEERKKRKLAKLEKTTAHKKHRRVQENTR